MVDTIRKVAPPIHIPWLNPEKLQTHPTPMEPNDDNDSTTQREVPSTCDSKPTDGSSPGTDRADNRACEKETSTSVPRWTTTESITVTPSRFSNRKQRSGKKKRRQRSSLASLATPEVEYFPVNIKKTVSRSKKGKK